MQSSAIRPLLARFSNEKQFTRRAVRVVDHDVKRASTGNQWEQRRPIAFDVPMLRLFRSEKRDELLVRQWAYGSHAVCLVEHAFSNLLGRWWRSCFRREFGTPNERRQGQWIGNDPHYIERRTRSEYTAFFHQLVDAFRLFCPTLGVKRTVLENGRTQSFERARNIRIIGDEIRPTECRHE